MRHVLGFLFGLHLLLGNVCLMHVAYAADAAAPLHAHHDACGGDRCVVTDAQETGIRDVGASCAGIDCIFRQSPDPVGGLLSVDPGASAASAPWSPLLTQAFLVIGPPDRSWEHSPTPSFSHVRTVVLRQ